MQAGDRVIVVTDRFGEDQHGLVGEVRSVQLERVGLPVSVLFLPRENRNNHHKAPWHNSYRVNDLVVI